MGSCWGVTFWDQMVGTYGLDGSTYGVLRGVPWGPDRGLPLGS